jgi:hypothetical protein
MSAVSTTAVSTPAMQTFCMQSPGVWSLVGCPSIRFIELQLPALHAKLTHWVFMPHCPGFMHPVQTPFLHARSIFGPHFEPFILLPS